MRLYKGGVTLEIEHPSDIARYKQNGYVEVKEETPEPPQSTPTVEKVKGKQREAKK